MSSDIKIQRRRTDYSRIRNFTLRNRHLKIVGATGNPPSKYTLLYTCKGYTGSDGGVSSGHRVILTLPTDYPLAVPSFQFETPIFHPNIYADGEVCLGIDADQWLPGIPITTLIAKVGNMIRFSSGTFNLNSKAYTQRNPSWEEWIASHQAPLDDMLYIPDDSDFIKVIQTGGETLSKRLGLDERKIPRIKPPSPDKTPRKIKITVKR